jgi:hypothetical protein
MAWAFPYQAGKTTGGKALNVRSAIHARLSTATPLAGGIVFYPLSMRSRTALAGLAPVL